MTAKYDHYSGHNTQPESVMAEEHEAPVSYPPVSVQHQGAVTIKADSEYSTHITYVMAAKGVIEILPLDPRRYKATVINTPALATGNPFVVLADSVEQAQSLGNIAASTGTAPVNPAGFLMAATAKVEEFDQEPLWAVNCDPSATAYVSVLIERAK